MDIAQVLQTLKTVGSGWAGAATVGQFLLVLVSIFFIWRQLSQAVKLRRAANSQALSEQAGSFNSLLIQDKEVARIWYSYGKNLEGGEYKGLEATKRYKELLVQWLILHENIYCQYHQHLLDEDVYETWDLDLKRTVREHNVELFSTKLDKLFAGKFGSYLADIHAKAQAADIKERSSHPPTNVADQDKTGEQAFEYMVRYKRTITGRYGPELSTREEVGSLLVESASRVEALAVAYDHLTRTGHAIDTRLTDEDKEYTSYAGLDEEESERRRQLNHLEMTDDDLKRLHELGVPVDQHEGSTTFLSLTLHSVTLLGKAIPQEVGYVDA